MHLRLGAHGGLVGKPDGAGLVFRSGAQLEADRDGLFAGVAQRRFGDAPIVVDFGAQLVQHRVSRNALAIGLDGDDGQMAGERFRIDGCSAGGALVGCGQIAQGLGLLVLMVAEQLLRGLVGEDGCARAHDEHGHRNRQ